MTRSIAIIGSGPSALMLAAMLDESRFSVTIYEKNFAAGRKFLVAGDGGFNLTHSENIEQFINRYTPSAFLEKSLRAFTNEDLRSWLHTIGIDTYVGSSKRVFPIEGIKPIEVLNAILAVLSKKNVILKTQHTWKGWNEEQELIMEHKDQGFTIKPDITVFALGGASWSRTGSDGSWLPLFKDRGITTVPFMPSNCAYEIKWDEAFLANAEGKSLKNISLKCGDRGKAGELVITRTGLEGGAIYALSPQIREQLLEKNEATLFMDLKPGLTTEDITRKLNTRGDRSLSQALKDQLHLTQAQAALLKTVLNKTEFTTQNILAEKIKNLPLKVTGIATLDEAISTVGGIALENIDENFQLKDFPGCYCIGEMLDWDAPTGGYLLQGSFSMGAWVARQL